MFSEFENPTELSPSDLDQYLVKGWRPMGQTIYTCHFTFFGQKELYSTLCTRLPLEGYQFRKSLRKLLKQNDKKFQAIVRPAFNSLEKEQLNQIYRGDFKEKAPNTLEFFLGPARKNIFQTYEVAVYDAGQLVALSFFDLGESSFYSKMGIYHPDYKKYSLGFYTMLKEIEFGLTHQKLYYHPGYVTPFYPMFDYKLRVGSVEYLDLHTGQWQAYEDLKEADIPVVRMKNQLRAMQQQLKSAGIESRLLTYRYFDVRLFDQRVTRGLRHPMFLLCHSEYNFLHNHIIIYHPEEGRFYLYQTTYVNDFFDNMECHQYLMAQKDLSVCEYFFTMAIELGPQAKTPEKMLLNIQEMIVK